jgi:hypothetical protein
MAKGNQEMQSWQVFHFARKYLTRSVLYAIFGKKNARIVDYWCEDPKYTDKSDRAYDPILGVKNLLTALDDLGHTPIVRSCIAFLVSDTSLAGDCQPTVTNLMPTMAEEELADYTCLAKFQEAIRLGLPEKEIKLRKKAALEEIERTYAKHKEVCAK